MLEEGVLPLTLTIDRRLRGSAQVYDALREAILDLRLKPGTPISENRICRQASISRTPVREAIIRLGQEGLVQVFPQVGSFVAPISLRKVVEGHFIRHALETALLRRAATLWGPADFDRIGAILAAQRARAAAGDHLGFYREDQNFHRSFARIAGMEGVSGVIREANTHLARVRRLANPMERHMETAMADHEAVFEAVRSGDVEAAVQRLQRHLNRVFETVTKLIDRHSEYFEDTTTLDALRSMSAPDDGRELGSKNNASQGTKRTRDAKAVSAP